ncbi:MAG: DUF5911 domain-containing protein [Pirellulales bacterium]
MSYQPIENYGVIGNLRTCALVGMDGSIDWLCLPHFDSPSVFGAILDDRIGGRFRISPCCEEYRHKQAYRPDTNILTTRFLHADGIGEVIDFMPLPHPAADECVQIVRRVHVVRGRMPFRLECRPAFDYARASSSIHTDEHGVRFEGGGLSLSLETTVDLHRADDGVTAEFTLHEGESADFVLRLLDPAKSTRTHAIVRT